MRFSGWGRNVSFVGAWLATWSLLAANPLLEVPAERRLLLQNPEDFALPGECSGWLAGRDSRTYSEAVDREMRGRRDLKIRYFFCTVYYTPLEIGFTAERGFDVSAESRPGLGGRLFPRDFLRAVRMEGFGRMKQPVGEDHYLKFDGRWGFHDRPLGNRNNTLQDRVSAAVHRRNPLFSKGKRLWVLDPAIHRAFGGLRFRCADTGGGLWRNQIDLYWGEDVPLGPGGDIYRPAGCSIAVRWLVPVVLED